VTLYVSGIGVSKTSRADAEEDARFAVMRQVSSRIEGVVERSFEVNSAMGLVHHRVVSRIIAESEFSHGEMIRIVPEFGAFYNDSWYAFAVLSREEAMAALVSKYQYAAVPFRHASAVILECQDDLPEFTAAYRKAEDEFVGLTLSAWMIRAIVGRDYDAYVEDRQLYLRVSAMRENVLTMVSIAVEIGSTEGVSSEAISNSITSALSNLGLANIIGGCKDARILLKLQPSLTWGSASFGLQCRLSLSGGVFDCSTDKELARLSVAGPMLNGIGNNRHVALKNLRDRLGNNLLPLLREQLSPFLPLAKE